MAIAPRSKGQISHPILSELLGHSDVSTAMIYTHILNRGAAGVRSPADREMRLAAEVQMISCSASRCITARERTRALHVRGNVGAGGVRPGSFVVLYRTTQPDITVQERQSQASQAMKRHDFRDNLPAPNQYLLQLGRMTTIWGTLESTVNVAISKLAGYSTALDFRALILVAHSNFQQKVDIISSLCERLAPEYPRLAPYKAVIAEVESAQKGRNKYAHNAIITNEETGEVSVSYASARGTLKTTTEVVHVDQIKEATAKIHEAMCALHTLVTGHEIKPLWERDD